MGRSGLMLAGAMAAIVVAGAGCEDREAVPASVLAAAQQSQHAPPGRQHPTTQQLLTGEKRALQLGDFPLTLQVPRDWALSSAGDASPIITVGGPASSGPVVIQLVPQTTAPGQTIKEQFLEQMFARAKADADARPHPVNRVEVRDIGGAKVLEQRSISNPGGGPLAAERWDDVVIEDPRTGMRATTRAIVNPHMMKWSVTVFLPAGEKQYTTRGLTFMGLKRSEFEQDREFLEGLIKSLAYQPAAGI